MPSQKQADANDSNQQYEDGDSGDSPTGAQLTQTSYPCEECDRVFPKVSLCLFVLLCWMIFFFTRSISKVDVENLEQVCKLVVLIK